MMTNHKTITLFCSKSSGRTKSWIRKVLRDVNVFETDQLLINDKEVKASDELIVRIPAASLGGDYVDSCTWKGLTADEALSFFTLKKGDYIVHGEIEDDVSTSADIVSLDDSYEIIKVTDNLSASEYSAHIKLVIK